MGSALDSSGAGSMGGAAGSILGSVLGAGASSGDKSQAAHFGGQAYQDILNAGAPPDLAKQIYLQQYGSAGTLTPTQEQNINAGQSQMMGISEDPQTRAAQVQALNLLSQRASGGLNPEDMAKFNQLQQQAQSDAQAKQQQIMQNFAARGQGGGGAELSALLANQQGSANRESEGGMQLGAQASQNALQAALQSGQLGGQLRSQDFGQASAKAQAQDMMNRFNVQNQVAQQQRNVQAQNQAQQYNLTQNQNIANANTQQNNNNQYYQNQMAQQQWQDQMARANALSGADWAQANRFGQNAASQQNVNTQLGSGLGQMAGQAYDAIGNMGSSAGSGFGAMGSEMTTIGGGAADAVGGAAPYAADAVALA